MQKLDFVIKTDDEYCNIYCFQIFGEERVESFIKYNKVGQVVDVSFNISSREYNGKYFHNLDAWKIFKSDSAEPNQAPLKEVELEKASAEDDLPF